MPLYPTSGYTFTSRDFLPRFWVYLYRPSLYTQILGYLYQPWSTLYRILGIPLQSVTLYPNSRYTLNSREYNFGSRDHIPNFFVKLSKPWLCTQYLGISLPTESLYSNSWYTFTNHVVIPKFWNFLPKLRVYLYQLCLCAKLLVHLCQPCLCCQISGIALPTVTLHPNTGYTFVKRVFILYKH